jgi:hypothetical protein
MRRLCLTLLCGLVAVPVAVAASNATGDGVLEIRDAVGVVVLNTTRGPVWGQVTKAERLVVTDPVTGDGAVFVSGGKIIPSANDNVTTYVGRLHFRVTGGKAKLWFRGSGIDLTAVGVGVVRFAGDAFAADTGDYALDNSGKWNAVPVTSTTIRFGVQPAPAP